MPTVHPNYPGYAIYWEKDGEMPKGGAFYAQQYNHSLIWYAARACEPYGKAAYKFWKNINRNAWNRQNLVYKQLSTSCYSPKVSSDLALATETAGEKGAFIALCQADRTTTDRLLGAKFPILWIPPDCHLTSSRTKIPEIDKTPSGVLIKMPTTVPIIPKIFNLPTFKPPTISIKTVPQIAPTIPTGPSGPDLGPFGPGVVPPPDYTPPGYTPQGYTPSGPEGPVTGEEGWPWWVWLLILAGGTTVGAVAYKKSKKGKKRGRK